MHSHGVSTVSSSRQVKGWERHLVLCQELSRSQAASQRRSKKSPAITALAISRYSKYHAPAHSKVKRHLALRSEENHFILIIFKN